MSSANHMNESTLYRLVRTIYVKWIRWRSFDADQVADPILLRDWVRQQRLKLLWFGWSYWRVLFTRGLPIIDRIQLLYKFFRIDWSVPSAHRPGESTAVLWEIARKGAARPGEVFIEAGCWRGGSSAKFSQICDKYGYQMYIFDSFEGVEPLTKEELAKGGHDYSGEYASPEKVLQENIAKYGRPDICSIFKGWFSETLARTPVKEVVRFAFIDCDTAKGTKEVLAGIMPNLATDAVIFSQDYHIRPVREALHDPDTWNAFDRGIPQIHFVQDHLAAIQFDG